LQVRQTDLNQQIGASTDQQNERIKNEHTLIEEIAQLEARAAEIQTAHDAATARLLGSVATDIALVLFPVRIETRFVTDGNGPQLLVRIYPDEIHIDTHETALTKEEVDAGMAYQ